MSNFTSLLLKGTLWKFLFYASSYIINLYIAHQLKAGEAGNFYYLINNLSIVIFFLGFGIDSAINFFNAGKKFTSNTLLSIGLLWCLLGSIIFSIAYVFLVSAKVVQPHIPFFYLAFFVLGALLSAMVSALFFSSNDAATPNYVPTLFNILLFTILFILK